MTADVYQIITDRLIEQLEKGTAPWHKPWAGGVAPCNMASKREYRGINTMLLACAPYASPYWVSYKQAQALGGQVRRGEKGTPVIFWKQLEVEDEKAPEGKKNVPMLRYYTVFNVEQCEGLTPPAVADVAYEHNSIARAEAVVAGMPNRPAIKQGAGAAYYTPAIDTVTVPALCQFEAPEEYYSTLYHELAHATGHAKRLGREGITGKITFGSHNYSKEELVAEMAAAYLCGAAGIDNAATLDNSAAYLASWIKALRGDKRLAITAAAAAQKAADYILDRHAEPFAKAA